MSTRTKLILLFVVLALLVVAILLLDVLRKSGEDQKPSLAELSALGGGVGEWLADQFAERLNLGVLRCGTQILSKTVTLSDAADCAIRIPRDRDHEVRVTDIAVQSPNLQVFVRATFTEDDFPKADRDPTRCLISEGQLPGKRLVIEYVPRKPPKGEVWSCWQRQEPGQSVRIAATGEGGELTLACRDCEPPIRVEFK